MSPEELRQQIADAIHAESCDCTRGPQAKDQFFRSADAILSLPAIRRALARDAAIEAAAEYTDLDVAMGQLSAQAAGYHNSLLRRLRAVGGEQ